MINCLCLFKTHDKLLLFYHTTSLNELPFEDISFHQVTFIISVLLFLKENKPIQRKGKEK